MSAASACKRQWKVPVENGYLVRIWGREAMRGWRYSFLTLGWLSYDPQQSRQFTSTRHIKQTHGLDSKDINDSWSASPYLPRYSEDIEAAFNSDNINIKLRASKSAPVSYIMSNNLTAKALLEKPLPPISKPEPPVVKPIPPVPKPEPPVKPPPKKKGVIEFGNTDFPALVNVYQVVGNEATRILDKETAEYVTSRYIYAQAFTVTDAMTIYDVSLAMRKFGGDGTLYIDVVKDENGKPGFTGEKVAACFSGEYKVSARLLLGELCICKRQ